MKVSIISPFFFPLPGGVSVDVYYRCKALISLGHEVQLFVPNLQGATAWKELNGLSELGVIIILIPIHFMGIIKEKTGNLRHEGHLKRNYKLPFDFSPISLKSAEAVVARKTINRNLASFDPDIVHVDCPEILHQVSGFVPGRGAARRWRDKSVAISHASVGELQKRNKRFFRSIISRITEKYIYQSYRVSVFPSDFLRTIVQVNNAITVRFLGTDKSIFTFHDRTDHQNERIVLYVGRMSKDKNVEFIVDAARSADNLKDVKWLFVGGGPFLPQLRKAESENIHFVGRVPHNQLVEWYNKADIFVSSCDYDAFGLTVSEAMATGLPIVVPDKGGPCEQFENGVSGFTYKNKDKASFLEVIHRLLENRKLSLDVGRKAVDNVRDWKEGTKALIEEVEKYLKNH